MVAARAVHGWQCKARGRSIGFLMGGTGIRDLQPSSYSALLTLVTLCARSMRVSQTGLARPPNCGAQASASGRKRTATA